METLLDHHLATFNEWLQAHFMPLLASSRSHYCFAVVTLLDQLDPKEYNWERFSVILPDSASFFPYKLLFDAKKSDIEFSRIVSNFLMDRDRAGSLWVNCQTYADLARHILEFLRDK